MKYIFVLLFIQFFVLKSQNSIEQVANKYHNIDSMSFMVELFTKDRYSDKIFKNTYYYQINKRVNDKYDWTNYDISMLSNYPTYSSFNSKDFIIKLTQRRLDSLEYANFPKSELKFNSNPTSFDGLVNYMPFSKYFFPSKLKKKLINENDAYVFYDKHPFFNYERKLFINKDNYLIDSIYVTGSTVFKVIFNNYSYNNQLINSTHRLPDVYPIKVNNYFVERIFNSANQRRSQALNKIDTSKINKDNTDILKIIDFWFIGCQPCYKKFPIIERIRKEYSDSVLEIVALNPFDDQERIDKFKKLKNFHFEMKTDTNLLFNIYKITGYPTLIILNKNGVIIYRSEGYSENEYDKIKENLKFLKSDY